MSPVVGFGQPCVCGCGRPAREAGGYATLCSMALSAMDRKVELDCDEPVDSAGLAEALRLDRIWGLE